MLPVLFQQYIQWRYAIGEDRESLSKVSRVANEEDQKSLDAVHGVCPALPYTSAARAMLFVLCFHVMLPAANTAILSASPFDLSIVQSHIYCLAVIDGEKRKVEKLCSRRKLKRSCEHHAT